ncbi:HNH endonuclease signature motif containing protein [Oceanobacter sp. 3_MG-2023]|uniref:HNH endonuclease signature motif containing protein n=1 Tax=Oceanobacter sp. 3_MG-2023 TaxID=3062622 RepID=UPI0027367298|nr:HNH endonuclease signature motif containing protein [Oceanobacter sp. 3_MG-2023]MDP2505419.1 HNH endonuclease signature motif containing protein [Oceanobacter sp. 3_MG-2023]
MKCRPIKYTQAELGWLSDNRTLPISKYTEQFNVRFLRNVSKNNLHALRKRKGWKTGRTGYFEKGSKPHNAGTKGLIRVNKTSFKKGQVPQNRRPMYSERINKDGYVEIKVPEHNPHTGNATRFKLKHRWVWEQAHGAIPPSHILKFKDDNKTNCDISNLELMPRGVHAILNKRGYSHMPDEIKPTAKLIAKIDHKRFELKNGKGVAA